ncbi:MAG: hypothetical protein JWM05_1102 [Acidimicrobiales bacterium]|nr:hypothetical protein [Acidimicrobiales bacterium]
MAAAAAEARPGSGVDDLPDAEAVGVEHRQRLRAGRAVHLGPGHAHLDQARRLRQQPGERGRVVDLVEHGDRRLPIGGQDVFEEGASGLVDRRRPAGTDGHHVEHREVHGVDGRGAERHPPVGLHDAEGGGIGSAPQVGDPRRPAAAFARDGDREVRQHHQLEQAGDPRFESTVAQRPCCGQLIERHAERRHQRAAVLKGTVEEQEGGDERLRRAREGGGDGDVSADGHVGFLALSCHLNNYQVVS